MNKLTKITHSYSTKYCFFIDDGVEIFGVVFDNKISVFLLVQKTNSVLNGSPNGCLRKTALQTAV